MVQTAKYRNFYGVDFDMKKTLIAFIISIRRNPRLDGTLGKDFECQECFICNILPPQQRPTSCEKKMMKKKKNDRH